MSTAVAFLGTQADRLILGKLIPISVLGVYGIAMTFSEMPRGIAGAVSNKVMLPAASKLADLPREAFRVKILQNRRLLLIGCALLVIGLTSFGDLLILALYDERYVQAAWMLPILALGIWPNLLFETVRQILMAIGLPKYEASGQFLKCLFVCIGLPLGFYLNGLVGAVIVVALNDLPIYGAIAYGLWCEGLSTIKQDIQMTVILFALLTLVLMARYFLGFGFPISGLFHT
jgi:O-antigen/teichoic acid export membrane protein